MPKVTDGMNCGLCLFGMRSGLSYWCDYRECYVGQFAPACSDFLPGEAALKMYKKLYKKEQRDDQQVGPVQEE